MAQPMVLIVDTNRSDAETLAKELEQEGYETIIATSLEEIDKLLQSQENIELAVIDISGFKEGVWDSCSQMHEFKIPYIVIAPQRSPSVQRDSMERGASGLLVKPVATRELIEYIHTALGD
jgi:DNA-binding response OmpR family regulator